MKSKFNDRALAKAKDKLIGIGDGVQILPGREMAGRSGTVIAACRPEIFRKLTVRIGILSYEFYPHEVRLLQKASRVGSWSQETI